MDKQMIEEVAIQELARVLIKASCKGSECEKCLFIDSVKEAEECCVCLKALYNAGYRKIPENAVVLSREEHIQMIKDLAESNAKTYETAYERGSKETAEKLSDKVHRKMEAYIQPHTLYSQAEKELFKVFLKKFDEICKEITEGKV